MNITTKGVTYIESIAKLLGELTGLKVRCKIENYTEDSKRGFDSKAVGHPDIQILFTADIKQKYLYGRDYMYDVFEDMNKAEWDESTDTETLLIFRISELPPCGLCIVDGLSVFGVEDYWLENDGANMKYIKGISRHCLDAMHVIMDIFATNDGLGVYRDRYSLGKTLMFAGNNLDNKIYPKLGFIKVAPYNNTRYEGNSRHIYLFESRKRRNEPIRKYKSFPKWAIKKFETIRNTRRKDSFFSEIGKRNKQN